MQYTRSQHTAVVRSSLLFSPVLSCSLLFSTRLFNHLPRYTDTEVVPMLLSYQSNQLDRIPEGEMGERGVGEVWERAGKGSGRCVWEGCGGKGCRERARDKITLEIVVTTHAFTSPHPSLSPLCLLSVNVPEPPLHRLPPSLSDRRVSSEGEDVTDTGFPRIRQHTLQVVFWEVAGEVQEHIGAPPLNRGTDL